MIYNILETRKLKLLIIEFHEKEGDDDSENFQEFRNRSESFYTAFMNPSEVDSYSANIHVAVKISNEWIVCYNCGCNYYLGYGPTGILLMRKAARNKGVKMIYKEGNPSDYFHGVEIETSKIEPSFKKKDSEFEDIIEKLLITCGEIEKRKPQYKDLHEENIRDRMLVSLNTALNNRVFGEAKNVKGKTDILIKSEDLKDQFIFELKIWEGIQEFEKGIKQLLSYLTWHDNLSGMVIFSHLKNFTKTITEIRKFAISKDYELLKNLNMNENEIRCLIPFPSDPDRLIQVHIILTDLHIEE